MPPAPSNPPVAVAGIPEDAQEVELHHHRSVAKGVEQYLLVSPSAVQYVNVRSESDLDALVARVKAKKVKKVKKPGAERYEKIDNEPIRI